MEREVLLDVPDVGRRHKRRLPKPALALAVLAFKQVARPLMAAQNLPGTSDFEALGDGFACLCFSRDSWHGAAKLAIPRLVTRQILILTHDFSGGDPDLTCVFTTIFPSTGIPARAKMALPLAPRNHRSLWNLAE